MTTIHTLKSFRVTLACGTSIRLKARSAEHAARACSWVTGRPDADIVAVDQVHTRKGGAQ